VAQFKRGDFSTCDAPRPGRPKTVTTPEIVDEIHELILEERRISVKSIVEKLVISLQRVGSIIHEDTDMRYLFRKWSRNVCTRIKTVNCGICLGKFWNFFWRYPDVFLS